MTRITLDKEVLYDLILREPQEFLDTLPELVETIFKACGHLSHSGRARLALDITNELCLTHQVNNWQYGADAVSEAEYRGNE